MSLESLFSLALIATCLVGSLTGQDVVDDPFNSNSGDPWTSDDFPKNWEIVWEIFSLPLSDATDLKRQNLGNEKLYQELVLRLENGKVKQEEFALLKAIPGAKVYLELVEESIYPMEWETPEVPNKIKTVPADPEIAKLLMTPATPTAFDTKNLGSTMEVEMSVFHPHFARLKLKLWTISLIGFERWGQGLAEAKVPIFTTQKLKQEIEVTMEKPNLIGTISPPMSKQKDGQEKEIWLSFITIIGIK